MRHSVYSQGKNKSSVMLFALSTCGMCKRVKKLLAELDVEYNYVDVDLLSGKDLESVLKEMRKWNPREPFPMLIINNSTCIIGDELDEIKKALGK